jgi:hypothetical protein
MKTRKLFFLSLLLVIFAIGAHLTALRYAARSVQLLYQVTNNRADAERLRPERAIVDRSIYVALYAGVGFAVMSALFVFLSHRADEPAMRSLVIVLLLVYGILHFAVV